MIDGILSDFLENFRKIIIDIVLPHNFLNNKFSLVFGSLMRKEKRRICLELKEKN